MMYEEQEKYEQKKMESKKREEEFKRKESTLIEKDMKLQEQMIKYSNHIQQNEQQKKKSLQNLEAERQRIAEIEKEIEKQ